MNDRDFLIPVKRLKNLPGAFAWPSSALLSFTRSEDELPLRQLASDLNLLKTTRARIAGGVSAGATVRLVRDHRVKGPEAYVLAVSSSGVVIRASTASGIYYGVQTLRDLVQICGRCIPGCEVHDAPDFRRRGVYLDCSRGKVPTIDTLKGLIEQLAQWKVNELQLYVENVFTFREHPKIGRGFSPFTPEQILAVQDHCSLHHMRLVPSFASFGHFERILALPDYAVLGEMPGHAGLPGGTTLCPGDPKALRLVADLYDEFLPLFDSVDFNACCDETWELGKGRSLPRAKRMGIGSVYLGFIRKLRSLCEKHGKRMNIWSDIILNHPAVVPDVPKDIVMLNWDYHPHGTRIPQSRRFAEAGLAFLVCPGTSGWQSHGTDLPNAIQNVSVFAAEGLKRGADGLLNTDWGDFGHRNTLGVSMHSLAHGAAHAWCHHKVDDERFTELFCARFFGPGRFWPRFLHELGSTESRIGRGHAYHAMLEALTPGRDLLKGLPRISPVWLHGSRRGGRIEKASASGCRQVRKRLGAAVDQIERPKGCSVFAVESAADTLLAAAMDLLAADRILIGKDLQRGRRVPEADLRKLADGTAALCEMLSARWLARNEPSRLKDNLRVLERAASECRSLSGASR